MDNSFKLRVKVGGAEFEAEGPEDLVKAQFEAFQAMFAASPPAKSGQADKGKGGDPPSPGDVSPELLQRAFTSDNRGIVSLVILPKGETAQADAILALLYGFGEVGKQPAVQVTHLLKGLRQSGLKLDRVDRYLGAHDSLVNTGGTRSGKRYSLNNAGLLKAKEIVRGMVE